MVFFDSWDGSSATFGDDRGARPRRAIATAAEEDYSLRHTHASRDSTRVGGSGAPRRRGHTADEYQHQATVWSRVGLSCAAVCHPHIFELGPPYHRTPPPPPLSPPPAAAATDAALPLTSWQLPLPCLHRARRVYTWYVVVGRPPLLASFIDPNWIRRAAG